MNIFKSQEDTQAAEQDTLAPEGLAPASVNSAPHKEIDFKDLIAHAGEHFGGKVGSITSVINGKALAVQYAGRKDIEEFLSHEGHGDPESEISMTTSGKFVSISFSSTDKKTGFIKRLQAFPGDFLLAFNGQILVIPPAALEEGGSYVLDGCFKGCLVD